MRREMECYKITDKQGIHYVPLTMDVRKCLEMYHEFKVIELKKVVANFSSKIIYNTRQYETKPVRGLQKLNIKVVTYYYINEDGYEVVLDKQGLPNTKKEQEEDLKQIQAENIYIVKTRVEDFPCYITKEKLLSLSKIVEVC